MTTSRRRFVVLALLSVAVLAAAGCGGSDKAQSIKVKLGGEPGGDFPPKPKGMHWRTYYLMQSKWEQAEGRSWSPWVYRMIARSSVQP